MQLRSCDDATTVPVVRLGNENMDAKNFRCAGGGLCCAGLDRAMSCFRMQSDVSTKTFCFTTCRSETGAMFILRSTYMYITYM